MAGSQRIKRVKIRTLPGRGARAYTFPLTSLADAMFQLLIFFMLSSSLTPYSLLTLQSGTSTTPGEQADEAPPPPSALPPAPDDSVAIWTLDLSQIIAGGQPFEFTALPDLVAALDRTGTDRVLLITLPQAQVQDIVAVLESLSEKPNLSVQLVRSAQ